MMKPDADPQPPAPDPAEFRRQATVVFRGFIVVLFVVAAGLAAAGWWLGRWWGLAGGVVLGMVVLAAGLTAGSLLYAMSQDGG